jgi:hypothetical protein
VRSQPGLRAERPATSSFYFSNPEIPRAVAGSMMMAERTTTALSPIQRHCERSEAIQSASAERLWIASSHQRKIASQFCRGLLAMTAWRKGGDVNFGLMPRTQRSVTPECSDCPKAASRILTPPPFEARCARASG